MKENLQAKEKELNQIFSAIRKNYTLAENMEITMECNLSQYKLLGQEVFLHGIRMEA